MIKPIITEAIAKIIQKDKRYMPEAYFFVQEALDFTTEYLNKPKIGEDRHVTGEELLDGIRRYALQEFGALAKRVLNYWGIYCCRDFGNIVYNMISVGVFGKSEKDSIDDFNNGYDFDTAFLLPFKSSKEKRALLKEKDQKC